MYSLVRDEIKNHKTKKIEYKPPFIKKFKIKNSENKNT